MTDFPPDSLPEDVGASPGEQPPRVLYPVVDEKPGTGFEVALGIAEKYNGELFVANVDTGGDGLPATDTHDSLAGKLLEVHVDRGIPVPLKRPTLTGGSEAGAIVSGIERFDIDVAVVPEEGGIADAVRRQADCDVVGINGTKTRSISSILAPIAGGPHSGGVVDVAGALAETSGAWVEFVHVPTGESLSDDEAETLLAAAKERLTETETDSRLLDGTDAVEAIVDETGYYDVTVIGAPRAGRLGRFLFGSTATDIRGHSKNAVVTVRRGDPGRTLLSDPLE